MNDRVPDLLKNKVHVLLGDYDNSTYSYAIETMFKNVECLKVQRSEPPTKGWCYVLLKMSNPHMTGLSDEDIVVIEHLYYDKDNSIYFELQKDDETLKPLGEKKTQNLIGWLSV